MALFDSKTALNHAIRYLTEAAVKRNTGGWVPPKERERQQRDAMRQEQQQARQAEKQQQDQQKQLITDEKERKKNLAAWHKGSHPETLNEDGTPRVFYHGTGGDFSVFNPEHRSDAVRSIFLSHTPEFANQFATEDYPSKKGKDANIMPVYALAKNPFDYKDTEHVNQVLKNLRNDKYFMEDYGADFADYAKGIAEGDWQYLEDPWVQDAIQNRHDGFFAQGNGHRFLSVYSPHQIKSATGNQGTFDPSNPDITKSEGGPILSKQYPTHYMPNVGRQVMMAGGVPDEMAAPQIQPQAQPQMPQRRQFSIASQAELVSDIPTEMPKSDTSNPSTMSLATAFDNAINHHLSLSRGDRILNSKEAIKRLAPHVGMRKDNTLVPLLGKNEKLLKTETGYKGEEPVTWHDGRGIEAAGLALSPSLEVGGFNTCPNSASCKDECLGKTSGNYFKVGGGRDLSEFKGPRLNSLNKTLAMVNEPEAFAVRLYDEIAAKKREAEMNGNILGVRLNVLSDINPRVHQAIIKAFPDVAFYDYTKMAYKPIADNHHYTYSSTGVSQPDVENPNSNWKRMRRMLDTGENVAMAFTDKEHLPKTIFDEESGKRYRVVNGDTHDFRPLDRVPDGEDGVIIGLKNKKGFGSESEAHKESGGFFVKYDPGRLKTAKGTYEREPSQEIGPSGKPKLGTTKITNTEVKIMPQKKQQVPMTNDGLREGEI